MIRNLLFLFFIVSALPGCVSTHTIGAHADYDAIITRLANRIKNNKSVSARAIIKLEDAYYTANRTDMTKIATLRQDGQPDTWVHVFDLYQNIQKRNAMLAPLLPLRDKNGYQVYMQLKDVETEQEEARKRAAAYVYALAEKQMQLANAGDKFAARNAYDLYEKTRQYYDTTYRDRAARMHLADSIGLTHIHLHVINQYGEVIFCHNTFKNKFIHWYC